MSALYLNGLKFCERDRDLLFKNNLSRGLNVDNFVEIFVSLIISNELKSSGQCFTFLNYDPSKCKQLYSHYDARVVVYNCRAFLNGPTPASFLFHFGLFKKTLLQFLQQINVKMSCPSNIWLCDSNPQPSEHEPPPITTRPGHRLDWPNELNERQASRNSEMFNQVENRKQRME